MDAENVSDIAKLVGGGGLLGFVGAVWYELRQQRNERAKDQEANRAVMNAMTTAVNAVEKVMTAVLEHVRIQSSLKDGGR